MLSTCRNYYLASSLQGCALAFEISKGLVGAPEEKKTSKRSVCDGLPGWGGVRLRLVIADFSQKLRSDGSLSSRLTGELAESWWSLPRMFTCCATCRASADRARPMGSGSTKKSHINRRGRKEQEAILPLYGDRNVDHTNGPGELHSSRLGSLILYQRLLPDNPSRTDNGSTASGGSFF